MEVLYDVEIKPETTLIIFDEVQEVPRALTALKYFNENAKEYAIVAAGSLLGVFLHRGTSFPVGQVELLRLETLSFEEFLMAKDREKMVENLKNLSSDFHFDETLNDLLKEYLLVGGMPEVVQTWLDTKSIEATERIQEFILQSYRADFSKYADNSLSIRIRQVFESLPAQFAKSNDKFTYGVIKNGARAREYELAIEWLVDAGLVRRVTKVERGDKIPLKAYEGRQSFKLYFGDIGLFRRLAEIPAQVIAEKEAIFNQFNGLMAEQFVCQQLSNHQLYYWTSGAASEVDFVEQIEDKIIPIEVKSGRNARAKSLRVHQERYKPDIAIRFSLLSRKKQEHLLNIPLFEIFLTDKLIEMELEK